MGMDFPHLAGDVPGFPGAGRDVYEQIPGSFDYNTWTEGTKITLMSVPWGVYDPSVCDFVPGFESESERDEWFSTHINSDKGDNNNYTEAHTLDTPVRYQMNSYVDLPFTFDYTAKYNYLIVEYGNAPVTYGVDGIKKWFYHITDIDYSSPSTTKVYITPDYWTTFLPYINISHIILERGHYPVSQSSVTNYLANPIDNSEYLLAPDVDYGDTSRQRVSHFDDHFFNSDNVVAVVVVKDASILGISGNSTGRPYVQENPDSIARTYAVAPNAYTINTSQLGALIEYIDNNNPLFFDYIDAIYFVDSELLNLGDTITTGGFTFREVIGGAQISINTTLTKDSFGYDSRIADLAKLYTYPYAHIEISSSDGNVTEVRIENLRGSGTQMVAALNFIYPSLNIDTRLTNYGGSRRTVYFGDVSTQIGGSWQDTEHKLDIPMYGLYVPKSSIAEYDGYYSRENDKNNAAIDKQIAELRAENAKTNAVNDAETAYNNSNNSNATTRNNALRSNSTAYNNAVRSAQNTKTTADRSASTNRDNSYSSITTNRDNSVRSYTATRDNALNNNATSQSNAVDSATTSFNNDTNSINTAFTNNQTTTNTDYDIKHNLNSSQKLQTDHSIAIERENLDFTRETSEYSYEWMQRNSLQSVIQQYAWDMYAIDKAEDKALALFDINADMQQSIADNNIQMNTIEAAGTIIGNVTSGGIGFSGTSAGSTGVSSIAGTVASKLPVSVPFGAVAGAVGAIGSAVGTGITTAAQNHAIAANTELQITAQEGTITEGAHKDRQLAEQKAAFLAGSGQGFPTDLTQPWFSDIDSRWEPQIEVDNGVYNLSRLMTLSTSNTNSLNTLQAQSDNAMTAYTALDVNNATARDVALQNLQRDKDTSLDNTTAARDTSINNANRSKSTSDAIAGKNFATSESNTSASYNTDYSNTTNSYNTAAANNTSNYNASTANATDNKSTADTNANNSFTASGQNYNRSYTTANKNLRNNYDTSMTIADLIYKKSIANINAAYKDKGVGGSEVKGEFRNTEYAATRPIGFTINVITEDKSAIKQAASQFLRYGYKLNQDIDFETLNVMNHFSYWKASDIWITGIDTTPENAQDAIRSMFYNGVTVWRNPDEIGKVDIYGN